ncbi:MAG: hypothetical protein KGL12_02920 [Rhodospirillales bacterium]|nr:hypothetical protein [Rhodospirillales bacterium]
MQKDILENDDSHYYGVMMFNVDETIDAFRRGALDIDCKHMVLTQHMEGGESFEGQGYIRQADSGVLIFKIYVARHNAKPLGHFEAMFSGGAGTIYKDAAFYDLKATDYDGKLWTATRILLEPYWDVSDMTVLAQGKMQSMTGRVGKPRHDHYLRLHFFEKYQVPLRQMSETEKHGHRYYVRDHTQFEICGAKIKVRQPESIDDTIVELTSETPLPVAFDLRIQEAFQYLTARSAFWRARLWSHDEELHLELLSPRRKAARTQFGPPISPGSSYFLEHGWRLFEVYLAYVVQKTQGNDRNPVAYHLYNACEATANSVDAWAVGISVAVEAVTGLIDIASDGDRAEELTLYRTRALAWLTEQKDLSADIVSRAKGQINAMSNKRPQDTLYALAAMGRVEKNYINAWSYLRNRHVHPRPQDLKEPTLVDMQKLLDQIHRVEVLLRQLTFYLIDYQGPFTDYGEHDFPSKQYPLAVEGG